MMSIKAILLLVVLAISAIDRSLAGVATAYGGANQVRRRLSLLVDSARAISLRYDGAPTKGWVGASNPDAGSR